MKLTITVECDNAAFEDAPGYELARILEEQARNFRDVPSATKFVDKLYDVNGNKVGEINLK
jgi:hypothetical protein